MDFAELASLAGGHAEARAIQVALKLKLFEALAAAEQDEASLAGAIQCDRRACGLLANALAALNLLEKKAGRYILAPVARRFLLESSPEYLGHMILFDAALFPVWARLEDAVRSGKPIRQPDMFQSDPGQTRLFILAMDSLTRARGDARYLAEHIDLSAVATIADVGGGPGTYLVEFLRRRPRLRGAIYDLPGTLKVARDILARSEPWALERIELREVDYLTDELPGPQDVLFMSNIIHSEDVPTNEELMRKCWRALEPGGRLIIKDHIMNRELTEPRAGAVFSLCMLLNTRGRDYSFEEVAGWLAAAGFAGIEEQTLPSPLFTSSLVLARKP